MNEQLVGIGITALVGIAGILSTHLLARGQRKGEQERVNAERRERYRFAQYEAKSKLYADLAAELRTLLLSIRLRVQVSGRFRQRWPIGLAAKARADAATSVDPVFAKQLNEFADKLDSDPLLGPSLARQRDRGFPAPVDSTAVLRRVSELGARIGILGTGDGARAVRMAESAVTAALLHLEASELSDLSDDVPLDALEAAVAAVEAAAIYELRLLPHGEKKSLAELRGLAAADFAASSQAKSSNATVAPRDSNAS
ncbi:hypothetical protein ACFOYW_13335 [Gryllotalpicola reticulitermitis]|uniref:Uncharacterized protein n=1 Tax=Gryllotalpicola reticulitermitis TaxID=1184153 RepID=A0ABV8Q7L3_9MICO